MTRWQAFGLQKVTYGKPAGGKHLGCHFGLPFSAIARGPPPTTTPKKRVYLFLLLLSSSTASTTEEPGQQPLSFFLSGLPPRNQLPWKRLESREPERVPRGQTHPPGCTFAPCFQPMRPSRTMTYKCSPPSNVINLEDLPRKPVARK